MALHKKGVMYTLAFTLFALGLLALAVLFFTHASSAESRHMELSFSQKIYTLDTSVQGIFAEAFTRKSGRTLSSGNHSLTIQENIPHGFTELDALIARLKEQVENDLTSINISISSFLERHALIFRPFDITYEQVNNNRIRVLPNPNITGYMVTLTFNGNITSCNSDSEDGGTLDLTFVGQYSGDNCTFSKNNIRKADMSLMVLGKGVSLELKEDGGLTLESNATAQSVITVAFTELAQQGYFVMPITVELYDPAFNFYKASLVQLPLLS